MAEDAAAETSGADREVRLTRHAGVVAAGTLASRLLGLLRDQVLAAVFTRLATDAFFVAFLIPNVFRQLLGEGAMQSAVVPVLAKTREQQGDAAARRLYAALRGLSLAALTLACALGIWLAPVLVELFAHGFAEQPGQLELTVQLTRWVFPYLFFAGTAALGMAALNLHGRFAVPAFAQGLLNVGFVVCAFGLPAWLGARGEPPILAMVIGALLGGAMQVLAQWPSLRRLGYSGAPRFALDPGVKEALRRLVPALAGIGVYLLDVVLARRFLSELGVGAQSYFAWALRLCDFPQGIFVMALGAATLPSLSGLVGRGDTDEASRTFAYGMRLALFVGIAATVGAVVLAEPLVALIFQRGHFDGTATHETARALAAQGLGIFTVAAVRQLVNVHYALGSTRAPVVVAALDLGTFVALALGLRSTLGHVGISLAVAGASCVQMLLLWLSLRGRLPSLRTGEILRSALRSLAAAAIGGAAGAGAVHLLGAARLTGTLATTLPGAAGAIAFALAFLVASRALGSPELAIVTRALRRKLAG